MPDTTETSLQKLTADDLGLRFETDEEPIDVLDLPQLYTKPSAKTLLFTLQELSSEPASWETTRSGTPQSPLSGASTPFRRKRKVKGEGVPRYLTKIISSPLGWIEDDEKERVWEAASQRLSERSGRTGRGSLTRVFVVPLQDTLSSDAISGSADSDGLLQLTLFEPALTGDDLGNKTWASSYLLAKRIPSLQHALPLIAPGDAVLELGSGTGLVGLAAAAILRAHVILTDLPEIVSNLQHNADANDSAIAVRGGRTDVAVLDWSEPATFRLRHDDFSGTAHAFPLILAADPIYSSDHPRLLCQAIDQHLSKDRCARVVVEMPTRTAYGAERDEFRRRMNDIGLDILDEGEEIGFDDWSTGEDEELAEVECWWSIWGWRSTRVL